MGAQYLETAIAKATSVKKQLTPKEKHLQTLLTASRQNNPAVVRDLIMGLTKSAHEATIWKQAPTKSNSGPDATSPSVIGLKCLLILHRVSQECGPLCATEMRKHAKAMFGPLQQFQDQTSHTSAEIALIVRLYARYCHHRLACSQTVPTSAAKLDEMLAKDIQAKGGGNSDRSSNADAKMLHLMPMVQQLLGYVVEILEEILGCTAALKLDINLASVCMVQLLKDAFDYHRAVEQGIMRVGARYVSLGPTQQAQLASIYQTSNKQAASLKLFKECLWQREGAQEMTYMDTSSQIPAPIVQAIEGRLEQGPLPSESIVEVKPLIELATPRDEFDLLQDQLTSDLTISGPSSSGAKESNELMDLLTAMDEPTGATGAVDPPPNLLIHLDSIRLPRNQPLDILTGEQPKDPFPPIKKDLTNKTDLYALYEDGATASQKPSQDLLSGEAIAPLVPTIETPVPKANLPATQSARFRAIDQLYDAELQQQIEEAAKEADSRNKGKAAISIGSMSPMSGRGNRTAFANDVQSSTTKKMEKESSKLSRSSKKTSSKSVAEAENASYYEKGASRSRHKEKAKVPSEHKLSRQLSPRISLSDDETLTPRSPNVVNTGHHGSSYQRKSSGRRGHYENQPRASQSPEYIAASPDSYGYDDRRRSSSNPRPRRQIEEANPALARMIDPKKQISSPEPDDNYYRDQQARRGSQKPRRERPLSPNSDYDASSHSSSSRSPTVTPSDEARFQHHNHDDRQNRYHQQQKSRTENRPHRIDEPSARTSSKSSSSSKKENKQQQVAQHSENSPPNVATAKKSSTERETAPKQPSPKKKSFIGSLFSWGNKREEDELVAVSVAVPAANKTEQNSSAEAERRRRKEQIAAQEPRPSGKHTGGQEREREARPEKSRRERPYREAAAEREPKGEGFGLQLPLPGQWGGMNIRQDSTVSEAALDEDDFEEIQSTQAPLPATGETVNGRVLYDYSASGDDELSVISGQTVWVGEERDGWYYCGHVTGQGWGFVPASYVQI